MALTQDALALWNSIQLLIVDPILDELEYIPQLLFHVRSFSIIYIYHSLQPNY